VDLTWENIVNLGVTGGLSLVFLLLIRWVVPPYLRRFLAWVDSIIPADLSVFFDATSRFIQRALSAMVLLAAGLTVASQLGVDMSGLLDRSEGAGAAVGRWLGSRVLTIGIIVIVAVTVTRAVNHITAPLIQKYLTRRSGAVDDDEEVLKRGRTLQGVVTKTLDVVVISIAFFMVLAELDINIAPILAGAGVVGLAIGLGAQNLIRDVIAGVFILLEDQYRVGDVAKVAGVAGLVEDINLRRTTLRDLDYIQHIIPNGEIRIASNYTKEKSRVNLNIEVAYKEDLDKVMDVLTRVGQELADDPEWSPKILDPIKPLRVNNFGASGIEIKVLGETKPIQQWAVAGEFRLRIKKAFDEEGIEIPFPHLTMYWGAGEETRIRQLMDMREEVQGQDKGGDNRLDSEENRRQDKGAASPSGDKSGNGEGSIE
jgi:small-conductance mechanosensitive channel